MKRCLTVVIFLLLFSVTASAESLYSDQYELSGARELYGELSDSAKDFFDSTGADPADPNWVNRMTAGNIFGEVVNFLRTGGRTPLFVGVQMLGLLVLYAAANTVEKLRPYGGISAYVFMLITAVGVLTPLFSLIGACVAAVKGSAAFMLSFVPVYAGILTVSGQAASASGMSVLLLAASEAVSSLAAFVILPLMGCYLAIGLIGDLTPDTGVARLGEGIKKTAIWVLGLILTLFLGLLSVQTTVNASADTVGLRTAKFVLGSFVPVAGSALSESLSTLTASVGLLKSSVGMYGVVAVAFTVLPAVLELLLWRLTLFGIGAVSEMFGIKQGTALFKSADSVLAVLTGVLLFTAVLFIISLAVVSR